jgi:hypothetical protein
MSEPILPAMTEQHEWSDWIGNVVRVCKKCGWVDVGAEHNVACQAQPYMAEIRRPLIQSACKHERIETITTSESCGGIGGGPARDVETSVTRCADCGSEVPPVEAERMHCGCTGMLHEPTCPTIFGSMVSHPKAQERQHITDAAWEIVRETIWFCDLRDFGERTCAGLGVVIVTAQEWDERERLLKYIHRSLSDELAEAERMYNDLREQASAELATLRAQLADKGKREDDLRAENTAMADKLIECGANLRARDDELERLREELEQTSNERKLLMALFAIDDLEDLRLKLPKAAVQSAGAMLLQQHEAGHKFGRGNG